MERTANRSGFKLRSGNSTPFKEIGARPIAPPKPGSSKEELMEIAGGFDVDVENIDLDYGGGFDMSIDMSGVSGGSGPDIDDTGADKGSESRSGYNKKKSKAGKDANKSKNIGGEDTQQSWSDPNVA